VASDWPAPRRDFAPLYASEEMFGATPCRRPDKGVGPETASRRESHLDRVSSERLSTLMSVVVPMVDVALSLAAASFQVTTPVVGP